MICKIIENREKVVKTLLMRLLGFILLIGTIMIFQNAEPYTEYTNPEDSDCTACIYTGILGVTALKARY